MYLVYILVHTFLPFSLLTLLKLCFYEISIFPHYKERESDREGDEKRTGESPAEVLTILQNKRLVTLHHFISTLLFTKGLISNIETLTKAWQDWDMEVERRLERRKRRRGKWMRWEKSRWGNGGHDRRRKRKIL